MLSVAALALAVIYPFLKRFFWLPQAWLGIAFGFGIPMAFAARSGHVPPLAWALLAANVFWAIAYDTEYAMVDRDDDVKLGLKSSAILFGRFDVAAIMACHARVPGAAWRSSASGATTACSITPDSWLPPASHRATSTC